MSTNRVLNLPDVLQRMDGRSAKWLCRRLAELGIRMSASSFCNYKSGYRVAKQSTIAAIKDTLSASSTARRLKRKKRHDQRDANQ